METDSTSVISIVTLIFLIVSSTFLGLFTFLMLQFSAKPKLRVTVSSPGNPELEFNQGQIYTLRFYLKNVGRWYGARPAATEVRLWINFEPVFEPKITRYGSDLKKEREGFQIGKGGSRYVEAEGIYLFYEELGEAVEVDVQMPAAVGTYRFWVAAYAKEGSCGVHKFRLEVI